jgi:hypothetical protein
LCLRGLARRAALFKKCGNGDRMASMTLKSGYIIILDRDWAMTVVFAPMARASVNGQVLLDFSHRRTVDGRGNRI